MTRTELQILCDNTTRQNINLNIECHPSDVALDKNLCHSSLIATQIKYLQRAKTKLPSYFAAQCIIPPIAFEQSSSEAAANTKQFKGNSALELTCGLGVDALSLSKRFKRVVTLERDELLAAVARENFKRLGISNVEVLNIEAEEYLRECNDHFDWIYVDPDRRGADGSKRVLLEECSPNILELKNSLKRVADRIAIKCSPMFDCDEAFRLFEGCDVEVVSVGDECKEVVIYYDFERAQSNKIIATTVGRGSISLSKSEMPTIEPPESFRADRYRALILPDVALQKGRIARVVLSEVCDIWSDNGYGFAEDLADGCYNSERHLSRVLKIESIHEYEPKRLRRVLSERNIKRADILKREFPYNVKQITAQLKITEGGAQKLAFTKVMGRLWMIILN